MFAAFIFLMLGYRRGKSDLAEAIRNYFCFLAQNPNYARLIPSLIEPNCLPNRRGRILILFCRSHVFI